MSINTYDPNSPACINALTQAHLLNSQIDALIEKLENSRREITDFLRLGSTGGVISTISAPKTQVIEEAAYALRGAKTMGDQAYMLSDAIKSATHVHPNVCRLDIQ